jgi:hypothetical protein
MELLVKVGKEVREATPLVNNGGCGLYASMIGSIFKYDLFTPVVSQYGSPKYYVKGNELLRPPYHVELLFEYDGIQYLYDACGFREIRFDENEHISIAESADKFKRKQHTHTKITWESLLEITQVPFGWNPDFHRNTDAYFLVEVVYQIVSESNITPDLIAVQDFMKAFRA